MCCACTWASVILAGKRDCRRHSTTSFSDNVVVPYCDQERAQPPSINIKVLTFLGRQKDYEAFRGVYFFENTWKNFKSNLVLLLNSKGFYWLVGRWPSSECEAYSVMRRLLWVWSPFWQTNSIYRTKIILVDRRYNETLCPNPWLNSPNSLKTLYLHERLSRLLTTDKRLTSVEIGTLLETKM